MACFLHHGTTDDEILFDLSLADPRNDIAPGGDVWCRYHSLTSGNPATAARMHRATLQLCAPPGLNASAIRDGKVCFVDELHQPSMARRTAIRASQLHSIDTCRTEWRKIAGTAIGSHDASWRQGAAPAKEFYEEGWPPCPGFIRPPGKPESDQPGKSDSLRVSPIW